MRCRLDGSDLELVAWGVRNAYGLGFLADGRLVALDQGADDRGSRPIGNAPDLLQEIQRGSWLGWPDFIGDVPVTDPRFRPQSAPQPTFVLENHHELPPPVRPLATFPAHSAATKFAVAPPSQGRWSGHLFVTLFGDEVPLTAPSGPGWDGAWSAWTPAIGASTRFRRSPRYGLSTSPSIRATAPSMSLTSGASR